MLDYTLEDVAIDALWDSFDWASVESSDHYERETIALQVSKIDRKRETMRRKAARAAKYAAA